MLSALQNFLSKVFSLNKYYQYYLESVVINDVDVQFFYLGKMTDLMLNFDMVEFEEVEDSDLDNWEDEYEPYKPDGVVVKTESTETFEGLKLLLERKSTFKLLRQVHAIFLHMDQILEPYGEIP